MSYFEINCTEIKLTKCIVQGYGLLNTLGKDVAVHFYRFYKRFDSYLVKTILWHHFDVQMPLNIEVFKLPLVNVAVTAALLCYFVTDANVAILSDEKPCVCGRSLTLTCKLTEYTDTVSWMNGNDVIPIAKCVKNQCRTNPVYDQKFSFTSDLHQRIFNLTIIKVAMNDNGRQFVCSDGSNKESWRITVKEYMPMLVEDTENSISVFSGCSPQEVTFKWMMIDSSGESEFKPTTSQRNAERCSSNSGCGNKPQTQYSETIYVKPNANGKYFLRCIADYGSKSIQSNKSSKRYTVDDDRNVNTQPFHLPVLIIGFVVFVFITDVTLIFIYCKIKRNQRWKRRPTFKNTNPQESQTSNIPEAGQQYVEKSGYIDIDHKPDEAEILLGPVASQGDKNSSDGREYFVWNRSGWDTEFKSAQSNTNQYNDKPEVN